MDLSFGPEYERYRQEIQAFLEEHWPPRGDSAAAQDPEQQRSFRRLAVERGYLYRGIPKEYGGSEQEPDLLKSQIIREEFGRAGAPREIGGMGLQMVVPTLLELGEDWQKEKWIPKTIQGEIVWCQGYSEPGSGSDLASLRTRAELVGDEWVINGQKIWTTSAHQADYMFILVRSEPDAPKHQGISYLLMKMKQPGVEVRPLKPITGDAGFNEVFLTDARTPKDWIVGKRGEGWIVGNTGLKHERNMIGNADSSDALFRSLLRLAKTVESAGRPAIEDSEVRDQLASLLGYVMAQRYSSYYQLTCGAKEEDAGRLPLMNKLGHTTIAQMVSRIAIRLLDSESLLEPGHRRRGNERWLNQFIGSLGISIAGGTSNIQRNIIAERGLGLPRDETASGGAD